MPPHERAGRDGDPAERVSEQTSQSRDARSIERRAREHYDALTVDERREAIRDLARGGLGDYEIASACRVSVEFIRAVLGERARP